MKNEGSHILIYSAFPFILTMEIKGFILFLLVIQTSLFLVLEINFLANQLVYPQVCCKGTLPEKQKKWTLSPGWG